MKIAVLVSGGVDSSVALSLLKDQGHQLEAFYLKIWLEDELAYLGNCPWEEDLSYVRQVCAQLGVPLHIIPLQQEYWDRVVAYTIAEVRAGRTPSPDLLCNQQVKFGAFFDAIDSSFDKVATGHYAQIEEKDGVFFLKKAADQVKDQTYFLSYLGQGQLGRLLFPVGHLKKCEVRALAQYYNLPNQGRKDSQGICFLGKIKFSDFIKHHLGMRAGKLVEFETGKKLGEHDGFWYHTVGQRKGLRLSGGPWFVVKKDPEANIVYISNQYYSSEKIRDTFNISSFHWINGCLPGTQGLRVKVRHGEHMYDCIIDIRCDGSGSVVIKGNDQGLAPGQFAVFYKDDICLGCGVIE